MEVEFSEELGAARLYHGHVAGEDFILQIAQATGAVPGRIEFNFPPAALHLFDAATGLRLAG
jgi:hypothetical protein